MGSVIVFELFIREINKQNSEMVSNLSKLITNF